jgi:type II secretory pathway pseudopilin PulG
MVKNKKRSFTLIEILIVAAITIILSGTSLAILTTYRDDKILSNQVAVFTRALELAKNKASATDVSLCSQSNIAHVSEYTVDVSTSNITLLPNCDTIPSPINYPIPTGIEYITPAFSIHFNQHNYQGDTVTIPIINRLTNKCKFVKIDETGYITNGDYTCP